VGSKAGSLPAVGSLGEVPQKLKQFADNYCLYMLTAETMKMLKILHNTLPDF